MHDIREVSIEPCKDHATMSQMHANKDDPGDIDQDELEQLLLQGVGDSSDQSRPPARHQKTVSPHSLAPSPSKMERGKGVRQGEAYANSRSDNRVDEDEEVPAGGDLQGALGLFAEAAQDMATAGLELGLGRHFACADYCNQAAEKAAQAVSLLRFGHRSTYNHDLRALGELIGAPEEIQEEMAILTPFHPETFYANTPPEEADEVISSEQASSYMQSARRVLHWAKTIVLRA